MGLLLKNGFQMLLSLAEVIRLYLLSVLVLLCLASPAAANISGEVEYTYSSFTASDDGDKVTDVSSFSQSYSLIYAKSGFVGDKRFGNYDVGLGYQWNASDSSINGDDDSFSDGKFIFRGEVVIAPGGLPFRFSAYSLDFTPPRYQRYSAPASILDPSLNAGVISGEYITSGFSIIAGIRNGSYLGRYRQLLSALPRLFIDYNQVYVDEKSAFLKTNYLQRDLALVSLNKKDNWFHYRAYDYVDYNDSGNDESSQTYLLGTIDQTMTRQWVNMTNWLRLSTDVSLTLEESPDYVVYDRDEETYRLNLFTIASLPKTNLSNFSTFSRTQSENSTRKEFSVPIYADGWIDPDRSWRFQLETFANRQESFNNLQSFSGTGIYDNEGQYLRGNLTLGRQQRIELSSTFELEAGSNNLSTGYSARARFELSNKLRGLSSQSYLLGYMGAFFHTEDEDNGTSNDAFEQELYGNTKWVLSRRNSLEFGQEFRFSSKQLTSLTTSYVRPRGYGGIMLPETAVRADDKTLVGSFTTLALETQLRPGLDNRFVARLESQFGEVDSRYRASLGQRLNYRSGRVLFNTSNSLEFGDDMTGVNIARGGRNDNQLKKSTTTQEPNYVLSHESSLTYRPNHLIKSEFDVDYEYIDADRGYLSNLRIKERTQYSLLAKRGRIRELGLFYQSAEYTGVYGGPETVSFFNLLFGVSYFPTRFLQLNGEVSYEAYEPEGVNSIRFSTFAALTFEKMAFEARYEYGLGKVNSINIDDRQEHLFETKLKKSF